MAWFLARTGQVRAFCLPLCGKQKSNAKTIVCRDGIYPVLFCWVFFDRRESAGYSFLFVPEKEAKRARRSDAAAAGRGCGPGPQDAATLRRPIHRAGAR